MTSTATTGSPPPVGPQRVAFYSHDTVGLGHTRRNLALAGAIVAAWPETDVLVITGNPEAATLPLPPNTDIVTVPTIAKDPAGGYCSRTLNSPLSVVVDIRSKVIEAALTAFEPDLLIVDKVPRGVNGELVPALARLAAAGRTRTVLGLREILDEPVTAVREWESMQTTEAIRDYYDEVWVYGDRDVYDPVVEYGLPAEVAAKISYTGYLSHGRQGLSPTGSAAASVADAEPEVTDPFVLCLVGGGQDGFALADAFVRSAMPAGHHGVVLTGPFMTEADRDQLRLAAGDRTDVTLLDFVPNATDFTRDAAAVVSMAGYNSSCEILATDTPALFAPRTAPRAEQLVRAQCFSDRGLSDLVALDVLDADVLGDWLAGAVTDTDQSRARRSGGVDLDGLAFVPVLAGRAVQELDHAA